MKKVISILLAVMMLFSVAAVFTACGTSTEPETTGEEPAAETKTESLSSGVLSMATNANFPPYEFKEGDGYAGIDVEIAGAIAKYLGMELEINDVEFGSIIGGVQSGKFMMGMAGMTVTDERKESVNFSNTYAKGIQSIIVKEDSEIASPDDLDGKKIGVQQDTTGDIYATDDYGTENVTSFKNGADAVQALLTDKVDCVIIDNEPAKSFVAANEGLKILDTEYVEEEYAICVAKENTELLDKINEALDALTADGTIPAIIGKYIPAE